jgi:hypothetical protein
MVRMPDKSCPHHIVGRNLAEILHPLSEDSFFRRFTMKTRSLSISRRQSIESKRQLLLFLIVCACFGVVLGQMPGVSSFFQNSVAAARGNTPSQQSKRKKGTASKSKTARPKSARSAPAIKLAAAAAVNDNCAAATLIASCPFTNTVDTTETTNEPGEPASECTSQSNSVWYSFTAGADFVSVTVDTCGSDFDTAVMVWRVTGGSCDFPSFVPVACDDDGADCGELRSHVTFVAEPGQTYKIQVGGFGGEGGEGGGDTGSLTVNVNCQVLLCAPITVNGTLGSGSMDRPATSGQQSPDILALSEGTGSCAEPKTCPGTSEVTGSFTYDAYTFTNSSPAAQCITLDFDPNITCEAPAYAAVYLDSYNPASVCLNYLADSGGNSSRTFTFTVPAGRNFVVVIVSANPGTENNGCQYRFTLIGDICAACPTLRATLPNGAQGVPYNQAVSADQEIPATYALSVNILPPGLSLNGETGVISGIPSAPGNYTFGIKATGEGGCQKIGPFNLLITAVCPTISISPTSLPAGMHGALYSQSVSATGGVGPYIFSVAGGSLPSGLTLNPTSGLISGTPTATGTFVFTVRAMSQGGCFGNRTYVLTINCTTVTIDTALPNPVKGVAYSQALSASPQGTFTFSLATGSLPPGFTLNSAGVVSGVTNVPGTYTFTVRARTASGCQGTRTYMLTVSAAP